MFQGSYELFQNPDFVRIIAKHNGAEVLNREGIVTIIGRSRWLGYTSGFIGCPEQHGAFDLWWRKVEGIRCAYLEVQTNVAIPEWKEHLVSPEDNFNMYFGLSEGSGQLHEKFTRSCQKAIRAAIKRGVMFKEVESEHELNRFYEIVLEGSENGKKFDVFSLELIKDLLTAGFARAFVSKAEDSIIGGNMYLLSRSSMLGWISSFDRKFTHLAPGNFFLYELIKWGEAHGYRYLDLGQQSLSLNPNLTFYKMSFAPLQAQAYLYRVPRSSQKMFLLSKYQQLRKALGRT
jgi:hypothetical protein